MMVKERIVWGLVWSEGCSSHCGLSEDPTQVRLVKPAPE
jgi:hypothetical protein